MSAKSCKNNLWLELHIKQLRQGSSPVGSWVRATWTQDWMRETLFARPGLGSTRRAWITHDIWCQTLVVNTCSDSNIRGWWYTSKPVRILVPQYLKITNHSTVHWLFYYNLWYRGMANSTIFPTAPDPQMVFGICNHNKHD